jgi:hypothetical protein
MHRSTQSKVPNTAQEDNFNPGDALERLHIEIVQLEAIAHAASDAIVEFPYPPPGETRRAFARIYSLVTKVAEDADLAVALGQELVASLGEDRQRRRATVDSGNSNRARP